MYYRLQLKFKTWLFKIISSSKKISTEDIHQLAFQYGIDRRRHPRVSFPKSSAVFPLPYFEYSGRRFEIVDLSMGGVCLFDPEENFSMPVGGEGEMTWMSSQRRETLPLQLVGVSYQKKHLEFKKLSPELAQEIERFLQPGIWGQKMHRSILSAHPHLETPLMELWIGVQGTNLVFQSDPHFIAALEGPDFCVHFFKGSLPVHNPDGPEKGRLLHLEERIKLFFFLYNIPLLSPRIKNLLEDWFHTERISEEKAG